MVECGGLENRLRRKPHVGSNPTLSGWLDEARSRAIVTSDPLADIRGALRLVSSACGASADIVVMGRSAADAFEPNPNVQGAYDKLRISPGELAPATVGWGIQSLGTYRGSPWNVTRPST